MLTNRKTTYILLEQGDEDRRLRDEIREVFENCLLNSDKGHLTQRESIYYYPMLYKLEQGLKEEIEEQWEEK